MAARYEPLGLKYKQRPDQFVEKLIGDLPGLDKDYREIASLYGELMFLTEAAPRPLVAALGRMLEGDGSALAPIFQDTDPLFSHSPHTGILWALEVLAWDPHHLTDAALALAGLARIDPGGKLTNRPLNSLREILLPWHPSTNGSLVQRLAALDRVIEAEPEVGWKLVMELLPGLHETASPTAKPRFREAGASEREVLTYGLVGQGHREVVKRALELAGESGQRWAMIIKELRVFEPEQRKQAAKLLKELAGRLDADQRDVLWSAVRDLVGRHKSFPLLHGV